MAYLQAKTDKLTTALYAVTDFVSDQEPAKWQLRDRALDLLTEVLKTKNVNGLTKTVRLEKLICDIDQIVKILEVVAMGGAASRMNLSILETEYKALRDMLSGRLEQQLGSWLAVSEPKPLLIEPIVDPSSVQTLPTRPKKKDEKQGRKTQILDFLKGKGWLSVTDIARVAPNYSTKTIQRELNAMIDKGLIRKKGEKRWSRYLCV